MAKSVEELLNDLIKETKENKENLEDINSAMSPLELLGGIATKIFGAIIDAMKQLDAIKVSNADLLVDTTKLNNQLIDEGYQIGTLVEHSQTQLNLTRIGYKQINKDLRDQLVFLDKAGGQGQDLVRFMATMVEKGATEDTITVIAEKIANIARFTGQSARAAIAAAEQLGDNYTVLAALGLDESVMAALLEVQARDEFPKKSAAVLGAFVSEMIDPKNFQQAFLQDRIAAGNALLNPTLSIAQKADVIVDAVKQSAAVSTDFLKAAGGDVTLVGRFTRTFVGPGGIAAIQLEAAEKMLLGGKEVGTGAHHFLDANTAYLTSFRRISDEIADGAQKAANVVIDMIGQELIGSIGTLVSDLNDVIVKPLRGLAVHWDNIFGEDDGILGGGRGIDDLIEEAMKGTGLDPLPIRGGPALPSRGLEQFVGIALGKILGSIPLATKGSLLTSVDSGLGEDTRSWGQRALDSSMREHQIQEWGEKWEAGKTVKVEVVNDITLAPTTLGEMGVSVREAIINTRSAEAEYLRNLRSMSEGIIPFDF